MSGATELIPSLLGKTRDETTRDKVVELGIKAGKDETLGGARGPVHACLGITDG